MNATSETGPQSSIIGVGAARCAVGLIALLAAGLMWGYVKDDAYISLRYAAHVAEGLGFVFNPGAAGEPVEGYTNFAWVVLGALPQWLGVSLDGSLLFLRLLGLGSAVALAIGTHQLARVLGVRGSTGREVLAVVAAIVVVAHPTVAVYATSGMEFVSFAALAVWAVVAAFSGSVRLAMGLALGAALMRPEGHLFVCLVPGICLGFTSQVTGSLKEKSALLWRPVACVGALLALYHTWRFLNFGALLPNTYAVKSGGGAFLFEGVEAARQALQLGSSTAVALLALAGMMLVRTRQVVFCGGLGFFFLAYLVWVGGDSMILGRLALPAWPFLGVTAALAVCEILTRFGRSERVRTWVAGTLVVGALAWPVPELLPIGGELRPVHAAMMDSQGKLGEDLSRELPAGSWVAYQDMGRCPASAMGLRFLDMVGLVSRPVAALRREERVSNLGALPRDGESTGEVTVRFRRKMRDLVLDQAPAAIVLVAYVPDRKDLVDAISAKVKAGKVVDAYRPFISTYAYGLLHDPRFLASYRLAKRYERHATYIMLAFYRNETVSAPKRP